MIITVIAHILLSAAYVPGALLSALYHLLFLSFYTFVQGLPIHRVAFCFSPSRYASTCEIVASELQSLGILAARSRVLTGFCSLKRTAWLTPARPRPKPGSLVTPRKGRLGSSLRLRAELAPPTEAGPASAHPPRSALCRCRLRPPSAVSGRNHRKARSTWWTSPQEAKEMKFLHWNCPLIKPLSHIPPRPAS